MKIIKEITLLMIIMCFAIPQTSVYAAHYSSEDHMAKLVDGTVHRTNALNLVDNYSPNNKPVKVAILDTGADMSNRAYPSGIFDKTHSVHVGDGYSAYKPTRSDRVGHGNAVTRKLITTLGGKSKAKKYVRIMEIDIFDRGHVDAETYNGGAKTMAKGIYYAVKHGAKVINISHSKPASSGSDFAKTINKAVDYAVSKGCIVVTSGGNINKKQRRYPSCSTNSIPVMVCENDWNNAWSNSITIKNSCYGYNRKICAPGKGYTSLSAPTVAAVAVMMAYMDPDITASEVKTILYNTATDIYKDGFDSKTGYGCVNAQKAVAALLGKTVAVPTLQTVNFTAKKYNTYNKLSWSKVSGTYKYRIYKSTAETGSYQLIKTVYASDQTYSYKDKKVDNCHNYYYKIKACGPKSHYKAYSKTMNIVSVARITEPQVEDIEEEITEEITEEATGEIQDVMDIEEVVDRTENTEED